MTAGCAHVHSGGWPVGADGVRPLLWAGRGIVLPVGRLHAVAEAEVLTGRARCGAPVALLDPLVWRWPDDGTQECPLCWTCLATGC